MSSYTKYRLWRLREKSLSQAKEFYHDYPYHYASYENGMESTFFLIHSVVNGYKGDDIHELKLRLKDFMYGDIDNPYRQEFKELIDDTTLAKNPQDFHAKHQAYTQKLQAYEQEFMKGGWLLKEPTHLLK